MPDASAFDDVSDSDLMQVEFDDDDAPMHGAPAKSGLGEPEPAAPATQTATEPIHAQAAHDDLEDSLLDTRVSGHPRRARRLTPRPTRNQSRSGPTETRAT